MGAIVDYDKAIKLDSQNELLHVFRAILKSELGDNAGAISDFSTAIKLNPKAFGAHSLRAGIKLKLGDYKGAVSDYNIAIMIDPQDASLYSLRDIAAQLSKAQNNQESYNKAIDLIQKISNP